MINVENIKKPELTPFLKALCYHTQGRAKFFNNQEALLIYEDGLIHRPMGFDIPSDEKAYIMELSKACGGYITDENLQ